jgi:hypothetical protein
MPPACPKIYHAAHLLFTNPQMKVCDAIILAEYSKSKLKIRRMRQAISKKKHGLMDAALRQKRLGIPAQVSVSNTMDIMGLSSLTNGSSTLGHTRKRTSETIITASTQTRKKQKTTKPLTRATSKIHIATASYRTPNQVVKAMRCKNIHLDPANTNNNSFKMPSIASVDNGFIKSCFLQATQQED